jgi:ATP-binding protein involved in chromosome partitioning
MNISREAALEALKKVRHPEAGNDIVSLGMVQDLRVEEQKISFVLKFQRINDPLKSSLQKASVRMIQEKFGSDVDVDVETTAKVNVANSAEPKILPGVKNFIAVASGKGGVGKSTVATNLAVAMALQGYNVGIIDADIFGPSLPKMFNIEKERPMATKIDNKDYIIPIEKYGVKILSLGLFVNPDDAMVWRGPMASNALKQLMTDAQWGELDFMFFDLPPGTSDIHLTLVQTLSVTGAVIVSTPQDVALADAVKGINMFRGEQINVPVLGLVENMSWFTPAELPENKYYIFGKGGCNKLSEKYDVPLLGQIPLVQSIREGGDEGLPSVMKHDQISEAFKKLSRSMIEQIEIRNEHLPPTERVKITTHKR